MAKTIKKRTLSGTPAQAPRPYEVLHAQLARRAAAEGAVLLKNEDHLLPIPKDKKLALFGAGAGRTVKGGTGSGDVNERYSVSIFQGLVDAGYTVTTADWISDYERRYAAARLDWKHDIQREGAELEKAGDLEAFFKAYTSHPFAMPAGAPVYQTEAEIALYVIARIAGENADRHAVGGDYFLSGQEHEQLASLCSLYPHVVVLVNAGSVVDCSFLDEFPAIQGLLVVSQPGMEGGHAVADILSGVVNPSGKLTDTWAVNYQDYPNAATFSHNNGDVEKELYGEGIYVGYRYFDSFQVPVRYGFGYGQSYTAFRLEGTAVSAAADGTVTVRTVVTNTGASAGKEVVQVYVGLPDGRLEKEARRLAAFAKTDLLPPGGAQELALTFGPEQLESYDDASAAWLLEQGSYGVYVGASLEGSELAAVLRLCEDKVLTKTEPICPLQQELAVLSLPRERRAARYMAMCAAAKTVPSIDYDLSAVPVRVVDYGTAEPADEASRLVDGLTVGQLVRLATGEPSKGQGEDPGNGDSGTLGSAGAAVPGSAAETSSAAWEQGIPNVVLADGPAGLRLTQAYYVKAGRIQPVPMEMNLEGGMFFEGQEPEGEKYYQYCTAIPVGIMLAQTWDLPLLEELGGMIGEEMEEFGVQLWLAPGMNIHRNPLCGRNFEYFAEDPLLSGRCASAITNGVQRHPGLGTTVKHFACNNQEDNRKASDSVLTERTLREIYLKGFEIAIKESRPMAIMTSYNLINGIHAANCYDICTKAARCEFGFDGVIMTDWTTTNVDDTCTASACIQAGNDLVMPGMAMDHENIRAALADGRLTVDRLKWCVAHLVRIILRSNCFED